MFQLSSNKSALSLSPILPCRIGSTTSSLPAPLGARRRLWRRLPTLAALALGGWLLTSAETAEARCTTKRTVCSRLEAREANQPALPTFVELGSSRQAGARCTRKPAICARRVSISAHRFT